MSKEDSRGGWSEDPFQNIQPREEHSPGGSHVTVTTIKSTIKRENTEGSPQGAKKSQIRLFHKTSKKSLNTSGKAFFGELKLRSTCTWMTERKKYGEYLEALMIQSIKHHLWNMVEPCDGMSMHGFQWWRDRRQKQPEEFWGVYKYTFWPSSVKWSKVD